MGKLTGKLRARETKWSSQSMFQNLMLWHMKISIYNSILFSSLCFLKLTCLSKCKFLYLYIF